MISFFVDSAGDTVKLKVDSETLLCRTFKGSVNIISIDDDLNQAGGNVFRFILGNYDEKLFR